MSPPHVEMQVPGTNDFRRIGFSGPNPFLHHQRGFNLPVHVATELGPISVEFQLLDEQQTVSVVLSDPGSSRLRPYCLSTGCVDIAEFLASQRPFQLTVLRVLLPLTQGAGCCQI